MSILTNFDEWQKHKQLALCAAFMARGVAEIATGRPPSVDQWQRIRAEARALSEAESGDYKRQLEVFGE